MGGGFAGKAAGEVARVVLDAVAVAHGLDHFEVEAGALVHALGLDHAAFGLEIATHSLSSATMESMACGLALGLHDIVALRIDRQARSISA